MTTPAVEFSDIQPEEVTEPIGIPNHKASASGESGDPARRDTPRKRAPGIFGGRDRSVPASTTRTVKSAKAPVPKLTPGAKKAIERMYVLIGGFLQPFNPTLGETIMEQAPDCAESVYELAQTNEKFRRALHGLMTSTLTGAVIFAHLPILMAVVASTSKNEKAQFIAGGTLMAMKAAKANDSDEKSESTQFFEEQ